MYKLILCNRVAIELDVESISYSLFTVEEVVGSVPRCVRFMETVDLCIDVTRWLSYPYLWSKCAWLSQVRSRDCFILEERC